MNRNSQCESPFFSKGAQSRRGDSTRLSLCPLQATNPTPEYLHRSFRPVGRRRTKRAKKTSCCSQTCATHPPGFRPRSLSSKANKLLLEIR